MNISNLILLIVSISIPLQVMTPSVIVNLSILGAKAESSLALGADTFLTFRIWRTTGPRI